MYPVAAVSALICGAVSLIGGAQAFFTKQSLPSLLGGGGIGIVLLVGAHFSWRQKELGLWIALVGAIALVGRFLPAFLKDTGNVWPALVMAVLGLVTAVIQLTTKFAGGK